jgi:flavin reductase (DIM6/NTAB) family NADH-FMN oxidoreductase RutF
MKLDVPLSIPAGVEFPEYGAKEQLGRWIWRHIQIPQLMFLVTTLKEGGVPNCEVNNWGLPFGFVPDQMFAFYCGTFHHTGRNILRDEEFVINIPGAEIGEAAERTAKAYAEGVDEITASGLTPIPSKVVKPPRIKECRAHLECRLEWHREVDEKGAILFCGRVVAASADRDVLTGGIAEKMQHMRPIYIVPSNIDTEKMRLTGEGTGYTSVGEIRSTAQELE